MADAAWDILVRKVLRTAAPFIFFRRMFLYGDIYVYEEGLAERIQEVYDAEMVSIFWLFFVK